MSTILTYVRDVLLGVARRVGNAFKSLVDWLRLAYSPCPYWRGNMINVRADGRPPFQGQLRMVILQVFQSSCWNVMEVAVMRPVGPPAKSVLKLFDRRFSPCVRDGRVVIASPGEWSPELEGEFVDYVHRGAADEWVEYRQSEDFDQDEKRNLLQEEVDRQTECDAAAKSQLARYRSQSNNEKGSRVPRVYATVSMALDDVGHDLLMVKGLLMEHMPELRSRVTE